MNKYYVYYTKQEKEGTSGARHYVYIEENQTHIFASGQYDPEMMEFTGVMVEADGPDAAHAIYISPAENEGEYFIVDEPPATTKKRKTTMTGGVQELTEILQELQSKGSRMVVEALALRISYQLYEINVAMSEMARHLRHMSKDNLGVDTKRLYESIKGRYIAELKKSLKYTNKRPGQNG